MSHGRVAKVLSAPSSLAVEAARQGGVTLCGFARAGNLDLYVDARMGGR